MTFQEAQAEFSAITGSITPAALPPELAQIRSRLKTLQDSLPLGKEFNPINDAIVAISPKLTGLILDSVLKDLAKRTTALEAATTLLDQTAQQAATDARTWSFEKPKLVANGLTNCLTTIEELRDAAKQKNFDATSAKADALLALLVQLKSSLKST